MDTKKSITVETSIVSDLDTVWKAWTEPEHITQWNFASDDWCCPKAQNQVVPNGAFSWRMEAKDGSMGFDFNGVYETVSPGKKLSYTLEDGRKTTVEFSENTGTVVVRETFETENTHTDEQQRAGWQAILENFKKHVESIEG